MAWEPKKTNVPASKSHSRDARGPNEFWPPAFDLPFKGNPKKVRYINIFWVSLLFRVPPMFVVKKLSRNNTRC